MVFALWVEDGQKQVVDETKYNLSNPHLDSAKKEHKNIDHWIMRRKMQMQQCHCHILLKKKAKENAWIVLTAGLLILFKWALILLNFCNTAAGLKVWLALEWESVDKGEELEAMGRENAVPIEVTSNNKTTTKAGSIGSSRVLFWEVERANLREWFSEVVCSVAWSFGCLHWCCLVVWWAAKNGSFLCFVQETEYPFMSIQNRRIQQRRIV